MTNPFNEIANLLRQKEERKRLEQERLEEERRKKHRKEQEERRRIEEENEKFIHLHEPMICRVLNQLGESLWRYTWNIGDIKDLQIALESSNDNVPDFCCTGGDDPHIYMQKISGQIIICQYLYGSIGDNYAIYAVGFQQIENRLIDSLVIAIGTFLKKEYEDYDVFKEEDIVYVRYQPLLNAKKLVSPNENCLVKALTEIVKYQYNL